MRQYNWDDVNSCTSMLAMKILKSQFRPDMLVAVARGGWIPARLLSNTLGIQKLASIGLTYTDRDRTSIVVYSIPSLNKCDKLLVVEDCLATGKCMVEAIKILLSKGANVKTAALFVRTDSILLPDYYIAITDEEMVFPWEY